jgi:hypothetical protein
MSAEIEEEQWTVDQTLDACFPGWKEHGPIVNEQLVIRNAFNRIAGNGTIGTYGTMPKSRAEEQLYRIMKEALAVRLAHLSLAQDFINRKHFPIPLSEFQPAQPIVGFQFSGWAPEKRISLPFIDADVEAYKREMERMRPAANAADVMDTEFGELCVDDAPAVAATADAMLVEEQ